MMSKDPSIFSLQLEAYHLGDIFLVEAIALIILGIFWQHVQF